MNKSIIIANWKMNLNLRERTALAISFKNRLGLAAGKEIVICPSFISLMQISEILKGTNLKLGAQDIFWEESGAYTGEESPAILKDLNCQYAIVGHSERRQHLGETDEMVNKKIKACLENKLTPIVCVGETFEERQEGQTDNVVLRQLQRALEGIEIADGQQMVLAYEPVWVIGSGQAVEPTEAEHVFQVMRQTVIDLWPLTIVDNNVRLIYGGSINPENVSGFTALDLCQGFLVGGASLKVEEFVKITALIQ